MKTRGTVLVETLVIVAVVGFATFIFNPSWIPGTASYRAKKSARATQQVERTTTRVDDAVRSQGEEVAASLVKIGEANAEAPSSPSKDFISQEIPLVMSMVPYHAGSAALARAEARKVAVMEGRLDEARRLYETASAKAEKLQHERDVAVQQRDEAERKRREADQAFAEAAAAEHARTVQLAGLALVALLIFGAWVYANIYGISTKTMGRIVADIRSGVPAVQAIDTLLAPRLHPSVKRAAQLATEPPPDRTP